MQSCESPQEALNGLGQRLRVGGQIPQAGPEPWAHAFIHELFLFSEHTSCKARLLTLPPSPPPPAV